jgi:uncharacterized membrane protein
MLHQNFVNFKILLFLSVLQLLIFSFIMNLLICAHCNKCVKPRHTMKVLCENLFIALLLNLTKTFRLNLTLNIYPKSNGKILFNDYFTRRLTRVSVRISQIFVGEKHFTNRRSR